MNRLLLFLAPAFLLVFAQAQELPAGKGKDVVEKVCGACHGTDIIAAMRSSRDSWTDTVEDMISKGATASETEKMQILDYLATNLGPPKVNVNKATSAEMATGLGITPKDAAAIVKYKQDNGDFKAWADLAKVPGIDQKKLEAKKDSVTF